MRGVLPGVLVLAATAYGADRPPSATGTLDGKKVKCPGKGIAGGVKATVPLLESCCDESLYKAAELEKAQQGDHVRLVLARPITVTVMDKKVEISELVVRLPLNTGVFWLRSSESKVSRYSKFAFQKEKPFLTWLREAQPAD